MPIQCGAAKMIKSYQEEVALKPPPIVNESLAIIGTVYSDGVSLIFDNADTPSTKHYKCNKSITFFSGDRVKIVKISGTYIVEYAI